jgi:hypothetical protein
MHMMCSPSARVPRRAAFTSARKGAAARQFTQPRNPYSFLSSAELKTFSQFFDHRNADEVAPGDSSGSNECAARDSCDR